MKQISKKNGGKPPQKRFKCAIELTGHTKEHMLEHLRDFIERIQFEEVWNSVGSKGWIHTEEFPDAPNKEEFDKRLSIWSGFDPEEPTP